MGILRLFSREELIDSNSTEPCSYYELDRKEVDKNEFEERVKELIIDQRLECSAWIRNEKDRAIME